MRVWSGASDPLDDCFAGAGCAGIAAGVNAGPGTFKDNALADDDLFGVGAGIDGDGRADTGGVDGRLDA